MTTLPNSLSDVGRIAALKRLKLLDSPAEVSFDRLTKLAGTIIGAPVCLISLVDDKRQFFKSAQGLGGPYGEARQTPLTHSFCQHVVTSGAPLVITNATNHPLVCDNLAIRDLGVMAYLGIPLHSPDRFIIGSFCVIDLKPRQWEAREVDLMNEFVSLVETEISLRLSLMERQRIAAKQQAVLNGTVFSVIATSPEGVIEFINEGGERLLGYRAEELVGRQTPAVLHLPAELASRAAELSVKLGRTVEPGVDVFTLLAQLNRSDEREWTYVRKDGSHVPVLLSITALSDEQGSIVGYLGVAKNISGRRIAEEEARASRERLRLIFNSSTHGITLQNARSEILECNAAAERILGLTRDQLSGRSSFDSRWRAIREDGSNFPGEMHPSVRAMKTGQSVKDVIMGIYRPDGSLVWILINAELVQEVNSNAAVVVSFADITERKELEINLARARDQALEASRLKSEFLATMSHEIRTPLNGVIGMSSLLLQSPLNIKQREMAEVIVQSADNLLLIINDILDFSKIEAGKFRIDPIDFHLRDMIEETVALLSSQACRKNLELVCDIDRTLATGVAGDAGRIQQLITNLLGNALKFTDSGEVRLIAREQPSASSELSFRISVVDTGIGIADAAKKHLFQPFVQADGSTTRRFGGTGLGLAICAQLVELMGGRIGYTSREGKGSTFWFELSLPRCVLPEESVSGEAPPNTRILVVDDHEANRIILLRQLEGMSLKAEAVSSAASALESLSLAVEQGQSYSVAILDFNMPGTDGLELARAIRTDPRLSSISLLMLSSSPVDSKFSEPLKFSAVLTKPVREKQLRRSLYRIFGRQDTAAPFAPKSKEESLRLRLLVAEDNPTNQFVAQLMIEQMGHTIEIANNGREVIDRLTASVDFDAILMDCQMPEMDGYETTRRIRAGDVSGHPLRIPIIALTAFAMPGDRAKALAAGMDDYVSKPLDRDALQAAFIRCGLLQPQATDCASNKLASVPPSPAPLPPVYFDATRREQLRKIKVPGADTLWEKALGIFMREMPGRMQLIAAAAAEQRFEQVGQAAHTIAGSAANLGALSLQSAAAALENAVRSDEREEILPRVERLESAWQEIQRAVVQSN